MRKEVTTEYPINVMMWTSNSDAVHDVKKSVVALGVFDGLHRGHRRLVHSIVTAAHARQATSVMATFDPHPREVVRGAQRVPRLTSLRTRAEVAGALGVDAMYVIQFDAQFAQLSPEEFVQTLLVDQLHACHVVVGENFRFGHKASGSPETLTQLGEQYGFTVEVVRMLQVTGQPEEVAVSSTHIRKVLAQGDVASALELLQRPFRVEGPVIHGAGRGGRDLGYPTANLDVAENMAVPADGVYAGWFTVIEDTDIEGTMDAHVRYPAAISVGTNPTFDGEKRSFEAFVLDQDADLYGKYAAIDFVDFVRGMEKFSSVDELLHAMDSDVATTRTILDNYQDPSTT